MFYQARIIKTKEARNVRDLVQAFLDLEEGLQIFSTKKFNPSIDYITWRKTMSEVNTYELVLANLILLLSLRHD